MSFIRALPFLCFLRSLSLRLRSPPYSFWVTSLTLARLNLAHYTLLMPARNVVKIYAADSLYHIYNRGVEKRKIFLDAQDYHVFLKNLKEALSAPPEFKKANLTSSVQGSTFHIRRRPSKNFSSEIELLAFVLMPNHFHLLIKQKSDRAIKEFMQSIATRYSVYFNKKYKRVGSLFQGIYKAVLINEEPYLLHLTRYFHLNPSEHTDDLIGAYSSYSYYLGQKHAEWLKPEFILSFFEAGTVPLLKNVNTYRDFVESYPQDSAESLGDLTLEYVQG